MRRSSALGQAVCQRVLLALTLGLVGCAPGGASDGVVTRIPGGKADDYYSDVAAEFEIRGELPVDVPEDATESDRHEAARQRVDAFVVYLTTFLTNKIEGFFTNLDYGGYAAMVRNQSAETVELVEDSSGLRVRFTVDVAGPKDLPSAIGTSFDLLMPEGAGTEGRASQAAVRSFDPEAYTGALERVPCTLEAIPAARNGYPEYEAFFEDGIFDITMFQGHDYNEERTDLVESFVYLAGLLLNGFSDAEIDYLDAPDETVQRAVRAVLRESAPHEYQVMVDQIARLHAGSGPFVKTMLADGREVRVEVRIFHSEMFRTDRAGQRALALSELVNRDVFFYNGHAGPWYGFYLDAAGEAEVRETEFASIDFSDRQQLFIANGCQTYSQYADMMYAHPLKDESNLDVITTVNYSVGQGSDMLVLTLTQTDFEGRHVAWSYDDLIRAFNENQVNADRNVFYGVSGIDQNPKLHPYANLERVGAPCATTSDCGDPNGNVCDGTCAAIAVGAEACPDGTVYGEYLMYDILEGAACFAAQP